MIKNIFKKKPDYIKGHHTILGYKFTILDPMMMPKVRQAAYHLNEYEKGWGITKENLTLTFKELKKLTSFPSSFHGNDDLISQLTDQNKEMSAIIDMLLLVINQDYQYDPFIKSACNIILLDDEKADVIDPEIQKRKLELCAKHHDIMVFFLVTERNSQKTIIDIYDILTTLEQSPYPKAQMMTEKRLLSLIKPR